MASSLPLALPLLPLLLFLIAQAKVPPAQQFQIVHRGDFIDYFPIEYGATTVGYIPFNDLFRLSFYNTTPTEFTVALRMGARPQESTLRWVWEANRGNPVGINATLTFGEDGNLVLAHTNGKIAWQTNTANKGVVGIKVLDNGNMVLYDSKGNFVWQSFDYPTDTLLAGQSLRVGGSTKLVSRLSDQVNANGPYSLVMEPKRIALYYTSSKTQKPILYYVDDFFNSIDKGQLQSLTFYATFDDTDRITGLNLFGHVNGGTYNVSTYLDRAKYNGTLSFFRLGSDGNLRVYTYDTEVSSQAWEVTYTLFNRDDDELTECQLPGWCGEFGLCQKSQCIACPSESGLLGWSESCQSPKLTSCDPTTLHYYKLEGVDHFMTKYTRGSALKEDECGKKCTGDCKCLGYFYNRKSSRCWLAYELKTLTKVADTSRVAYIKMSNNNSAV